MSPEASVDHDLNDLFSMVEDILSRDEFHQEITRIQGEFTDLIDEIAAAYVLVAEHGRLGTKEVRSGELRDGGYISMEGRITRLDRLRTFNRKDGTTGQVISLYMVPEVDRKDATIASSGEIRISFWGNKDIERVQAGEYKGGDRIVVINGRVKINNYGTTVNVGKYSEVKLRKE